MSLLYDSRTLCPGYCIRQEYAEDDGLECLVSSPASSAARVGDGCVSRKHRFGSCQQDGRPARRSIAFGAVETRRGLMGEIYKTSNFSWVFSYLQRNI